MSTTGRRWHGRGAKALCVALSMTLAPGCSTVRPVHPTAAGYQDTLRPGDQIRIVTRSGPTLELTVSAVTRDAIVGVLRTGGPNAGAEVTVPLSDVGAIERTEFSGARTVGLVASIGAAVATVLAVVFFIAVLGFATSWGGQTDGPPRAAPAR